jgi:hypothetical protein
MAAGPRGAPLPKAPAAPVPSGISAASLSRRIDEFLAAKGILVPGASGLVPSEAARPSGSVSLFDKPADFVCEEDVRQAVRHGRKIVIGVRSIVTPAARDLGEEHRIFVLQGLGI